MLPYTIIKEANPPEMSGTATGVVNFLIFLHALLGPVFGWIPMAVSGGASTMTLAHYQTAFEPLLYGVALAILARSLEGNRMGGATARADRSNRSPP